MAEEYRKVYDDNGGFGHVVTAHLDSWGEVAVQCHRVTAFAPDDGTIEASELLLHGTIRPDGQSGFSLEASALEGPGDATRLGLAARRCYHAARDLLGPEATAKWLWGVDLGGWRTHPDAIEIAKNGWPKTGGEPA